MKTFRSGSIALVLAVGLMLTGCVSPDETPSYYQNLESHSAQIDASVVASMISSYRSQSDLSPVTVDPALMRVAQAQADGMARAEDVNAARKGDLKLAVLMKGAGQGDAHAVGNLSAGYRRWAEAFSGWRDSPKHNAVMLDANGTRIGIATAYAPRSKYKVFWSLVVVGPR
ncbi:CAP domain-containing protein [Pseudovibrio sp. Ad37]|uniref:CAP domain-containing protein n=1 Tax=Pseudovibrio sp. Ad37 TaxID=989422 RepID=UPI0007AEAA6C|nr:CAP domain-containing protein [Pseudovibrio sp. Ad37]KZL29549.1 Cysteine-rich secretory protein family protein [Pseudovibrio sp. Ad37]